MYNDKFETRSAKSGKKFVALLLVMVLLLGAAIGTTYAWLIDNTTPVKNTFTVGNIDIDLKEYDAEDAEVAGGMDFTVIPGQTVTKKALVSVTDDSESCWLFVKIVEENNVNNLLDWAPAAGWELAVEDGNTSVYYRVVGKDDAVKTFSVLAGDKVSVSETMTKADVDALGDATPSLTFTAYAIQSELLKDGDGNPITTVDAASAAKAWERIGA